MFWKFRIISVLLFTVVPAGCLPLVTAGGVVDEVKANRNPRANPADRSTAVGIGFIAVCAALAFVANVRLKRLVSRLRREPDEGWFGLSRQASLTLVAAAYALGLFCGVQMLLLFSGLAS